MDLFAGPPEEERFVGTFKDLLPGGEVYCILLGNPDEPKVKGAGCWDAFRVGRPLKPRGRVTPSEPRIRHVGDAVPVPPEHLALGRETHLLMDDWSVAKTCNIRRAFHRPVKHPDSPLIVCDRPWERTAIYLFGGVERRKDGRYRMWYGAADATSENRKNVHTCLATSDDGLHWTKPALGLHQYQRTHDNNIVIKDAGVSMVFTNADDPRPDFRYLAKVRHQGTQGWTSPDGLHWTNHGVIIPQSIDATSCHWDPVRRKYIASVKLGYQGRRFRGYAESEDFIQWTDTYLMMDVDHLDVAGDQIYQMQILHYESLYLGLCKIYHVGTSDTCDIQLAVSHNCTHWERPYRMIGSPKFATKEKDIIEYPDPHTQPFIPTGPPGAWDFGNQDCPATAPVREADELRFYYTGRYQSHSRLNPRVKDWQRPASSIGLATLRVDGFVSADADASGGYVLTKPLWLDGRNLFVNANAAEGVLKVEALDTRGEPSKGYALADAGAIRSNHVRTKCRWKGRRDASSLAGRTVRLRFHLAGASLYSFWYE